MKKRFGIVAAVVVVGSQALATAGEPGGSGLPRGTPEEQGVSSPAVLSFVRKADETIDAMHSVMLVRHGKVVAEGWWSPYDAETRHQLYSLSKSFTSTAVGLAVADGKLSVDDAVLKFFPDDAPESPSDNLRQMRVSDLLRMSTGHQAEPKRPDDQVWTKVFLAQPVPFKPGTHFLYNTSGTYMLSAIVQKATGQTVLDYLGPRLFEPLGIEGPTWGTSPQGVSLGGYGLSVRTEDIAKFGQLYLQKGKWGDKQLVPESWVAAATARQTSNGSNPMSDWDQGYGYQFWRCRHGAYRGDGAFGQYCIVLPEQDAVVAITSGVKDMQAVLNLVWDELLPALKPEPLPPDEAAAAKLKETLKGLALRPQAGAPAPGSTAKALNRTFRFPNNDRKIESVTLERNGDGPTTLVIHAGGTDRRIVCTPDSWTKGKLAFDTFGRSPFGGGAEQAVASSGGWKAEDIYAAKVVFVETPFLNTMNLKFDGDEVRLTTESNVGFGPTRQAELVGKAD
jgi:CubicO group peptidase (beta-lactamase class C family)